MTKTTAVATTSASARERNPETDAERLACFEAWNVSMDFGGGRGIGEFAFLTFDRKLPKFMIWGQVARLCDKPKSTLRDMANKRAYSLTTEKGKKALMRLKQIGALPATTSGTVVIKASQVSGLLSEFNAPEKVQEDFKIMRKKARPPAGLRGMLAGGKGNVSAAKPSPALAHGASTSSHIKLLRAAPKLQRQGSLQQQEEEQLQQQEEEQQQQQQQQQHQQQQQKKKRQQREEEDEEEDEVEKDGEGEEEQLQLQQPQRVHVNDEGSQSEDGAEGDSDEELGMRRVGDCTPVYKTGAAIARRAGAGLPSQVVRTTPGGAGCSR